MVMCVCVCVCVSGVFGALFLCMNIFEAVSNN